jgi:hypothetical protein
MREARDVSMEEEEQTKNKARKSMSASTPKGKNRLVLWPAVSLEKILASIDPLLKAVNRSLLRGSSLTRSPTCDKDEH